MRIFLDFDGVLRRSGSPARSFDRPCFDLFEDTVRRLEDIEIVISSSWRELESLGEIRARFSPDVASRIAGVVPIVPSRDPFPRHREVREFLRNAGVDDEAWIGIDDDPTAYPAGCAVILTDPAVGFDVAAARRLIELAAALP